MKDRKRGKWTEPPRPVGTKTKVWMIAWEETWEGWKEDRAKNLEKYLAIETKTWFKKKKRHPPEGICVLALLGQRAIWKHFRKLTTMIGVLICARDLWKSTTVLNLLLSPPNAGITASATTPAWDHGSLCLVWDLESLPKGNTRMAGFSSKLWRSEGSSTAFCKCFVYFLKKTSTRILFIQGKSLYFRQRKSKRICHRKSVLKGWPFQGTMWKKKSWNNRKKKYGSKILC